MPFITNITWDWFCKHLQKALVLVLMLIVQISNAQYIHEIIDYKPAPGQFINSNGGTMESAQGIIGSEGGLVSLGGFGGYIVFSFEGVVKNDLDNPYGVDFVIFGNASAEFSEAGIVSVMKDENGNMLADDTWYELAGSDHFFSTTIKNYTITYSDPETYIASDIFWEDNFLESGFVFANSFHSQSYYPDQNFDASFYSGNCTFSGTKISAITDFSDVYRLRSYPRKFGYADNIMATGIDSDLPDNPYTTDIEGMGGDAMDISWAIDQDGNYIELDEIQFVKIHTAVNDNAGSLGELSTEIRSAIDIHPDYNAKEADTILVIEDFPKEILPGDYNLYAHLFESGRKIAKQNISWSVIHGNASISIDGVLLADEIGELNIMARCEGVEASIQTEVMNDISTNSLSKIDSPFRVYPNPFSNQIRIMAKGILDIELLTINGRVVSRATNIGEDYLMSTHEIPAGIYFLKLMTISGVNVYKLIKQEN